MSCLAYRWQIKVCYVFFVLFFCFYTLLSQWDFFLSMGNSSLSIPPPPKESQLQHSRATQRPWLKRIAIARTARNARSKGLLVDRRQFQVLRVFVRVFLHVVVPMGMVLFPWGIRVAFLNFPKGIIKCIIIKKIKRKKESASQYITFDVHEQTPWPQLAVPYGHSNDYWQTSQTVKDQLENGLK